MDLVGLQQVSWDKDGTEPVEVCTLSYGEVDENHD